MTEPTFCFFTLQSESWVCYEQVHRARCDTTLQMGTLFLILLDLWLMLYKAGCRALLVVQIIFHDWSERQGRSKCNCVGSALYHLQCETEIRGFFLKHKLLCKVNLVNWVYDVSSGCDPSLFLCFGLIKTLLSFCPLNPHWKQTESCSIMLHLLLCISLSLTINLWLDWF